ncbi:histidine N-acetyltransferase-like [Haliotis rubra]|uniref:histidine N-acetyltransferase-like n=1 Tax=Haliotis rubra TaxID=36100 RepID=UPI001EE51668|nr:histidine N-acetyltransferase-like [Haliotis rubra]
MSKHHIRRATADDFQAVMDIGDVLFGLDYLPQHYHTFIDDPNARSYVYLVGEEIVGFCSPHIIDNGTTFLMRGSRVKDGFRGQGIYGRLLKHVYDDFTDTDTIKRDVMTTNNVNYEKNGGLKKTHTFISKKETLNYGTKLTDVNLPVISADDRPKTFTAADMKLLLDCKESCEELFPDGKMVVAWLPLDLLPANLKYMVPPDSFALQSRADNTHVSLLTVASTVKCQRGLRYFCDVFGRDATSLRHHLVSHLHNARSLTEGFVVFEIIIETSLRVIAGDIMKDVGVPILDLAKQAMVLLEKPFG